MYTPASVVRVVEVRLEDEREVLLHLGLGHAKPPEVHLVGCYLEQFALVPQRDLAVALGVRVDVRPVSLPQVPLGVDPFAVQKNGAVVCHLAASASHVEQPVAGAPDVPVVGTSAIVAVIGSLWPLGFLLAAGLDDAHFDGPEVPETGVQVDRQPLDG
jgi:hypothetical protein